MTEKELIALVGQAAFDAMTAEQRTALMGKVTKPAPKEGDPLAAVMEAIKAIQTDVNALKGGKTTEEDPTLATIQKNKKATGDQKATQDRIVSATKFNVGMDTFLKEYTGVLPADAFEITKTATPAVYPDEIVRASANKASLITSFFKEKESDKFLSEAQRAKLKAWQSLGTEARREEADAIYESVFEPAVNHARSIRQAQIKNKEDTFTGSTDSDIVMKKVHTKTLRSLMQTHKLNDVLHEQAKALGLVGQQT